MDSINNEHSTTKELPIPVKILIGFLGGASISGLMLYLGGIGILFTMLMFIALIIGAIVYGFTGTTGAAVMAVTAETGIMLTGGTVGCIIMLAAFILPYAVLVVSCEKKFVFFKTLEFTMLSMGLGIVLALFTVVWTSGSDIGSLMSSMMLSSINALSDEAKLTMSEFYASMFEVNGIALDISDPAVLLNTVAASMEDASKLAMPLMLITLVLLNSLLGTLIACFIRTKRGIEGASYVPVSGWRLPWHVTLGVILFLILGYILAMSDYGSGEVVYVTAIGTAFLACTVQTIASIYEKMSLVGIRFGFRILWIIGLVLIFGSYMLFYGSFSALFGKKGMFKQLRAFWGKKPKGSSEI